MNWTTMLPELPSTATEKRKAKKAFEEHSEKLLREWENRKNNPPARRAESPNAWFKREAYRLLRHFVDLDWEDIFKVAARADKRPNRLVQEALKNPFKLGLLAMFSDESPLSRLDRHVFGNQMLYAWLHDVPPEFLNGFIAVSGSHALISKKLKSGFVEPGFEHRYREKLGSKFADVRR